MNKTELKKKMMEAALPLMTHYQTDLIYCFEVIDRINAIKNMEEVQDKWEEYRRCKDI